MNYYTQQRQDIVLLKKETIKLFAICVNNLFLISVLVTMRAKMLKLTAIMTAATTVSKVKSQLKLRQCAKDTLATKAMNLVLRQRRDNELHITVVSPQFVMFAESKSLMSGMVTQPAEKQIQVATSIAATSVSKVKSQLKLQQCAKDTLATKVMNLVLIQNRDNELLTMVIWLWFVIFAERLSKT